MKSQIRPAALAAALLFGTLPAAGHAAVEPQSGAGADEKARAVAEAKCNACHAYAPRAAAGYDAQGWRTVLRMMVNHGAPLTKQDIALLTPYLVKTYPEKPRPPALLIAGPVKVSMKVTPVPTPGSRPHDPLATRDGAIWYTGQLAGVLGRLDPKTGKWKEYALKTPHSAPHGLVEDKDGNIWYTGNAAGLIGKLDPKSGAVSEYPLPDPAIRDAHTLIFDPAGILWFTAQNGNRIGRLDPASGEIRLLTPPTANARPYGMAVDSKGTVFVVEFGVNQVAAVDPRTLAIREYKLPDPAARPRRITITGDDMVWYSDYARGMIGRLDPATGKVSEWPSPSGPQSAPYGMSAIGGAIWYSESNAKPNTVVRFDPKTEKFQSWAIPGGGNIVRNTSVTPDGNFVLANSLVNAVTLVKIAR